MSFEGGRLWVPVDYADDVTKEGYLNGDGR